MMIHDEATEEIKTRNKHKPEAKSLKVISKVFT